MPPADGVDAVGGQQGGGGGEVRGGDGGRLVARQYGPALALRAAQRRGLRAKGVEDGPGEHYT